MGTLAEEMPETQPALLCSAGNVQEAACCPGTPAGLAELGGGPMGALTAASQSSPDDPGAPSPGTPQDPPGRRLRRDTPGTGRAPAPSPSRAAAPSRSRPAGALTGAAGGPGGCGTSLGLGRLRIRPLGSRKRESGSDTEPRGAGPGHAWAGLWRGGGAMSRAGRDRVTRGRGLCLGRGQVRAERGRVTRGRGLGWGRGQVRAGRGLAGLPGTSCTAVSHAWVAAWAAAWLVAQPGPAAHRGVPSWGISPARFSGSRSPVRLPLGNAS